MLEMPGGDFKNFSPQNGCRLALPAAKRLFQALIAPNIWQPFNGGSYEELFYS